MCDFHSVIVTGDGRILHNPSNSHSAIASEHNLGYGLDAKWWECEWNGTGDMPEPLVQTRGKTAVPTSLAERAAEAHYRKLALVMSGDLDPNVTAPFDRDEYRDVRDAYHAAIAERKADEMIGPIIEAMGDMSSSAANKMIRRLVDDLNLDMSEIAADEIESAIDNDTSRYNEGYEDGAQAACEDMYTWESVQDHIDEAKEEWESKQEEEIATARDEAYEEGYMDAKRGKAPAVEFIGNMPSFLI